LAAAIARRAGAAPRVVRVFSAREAAGEALLVTVENRLARQRRERGKYLDRLDRGLKRAHPLELSAGQERRG
jgi:hypothetical protein